MVIVRLLAPAAFLAFFSAVSWAQLGPAALRTPPEMTTIWAAKPEPSPFVAPNRPLWKLSDILSTHAGQKDWSVLLVRDPGGLTAQYIQMGPGEKTKTMLFADSSIFWVVQAGQIRFTIDGQEPFVASKGFMVHVPQRTRSPWKRWAMCHRCALKPATPVPRRMYPITRRPIPIKGATYMRRRLGRRSPRLWQLQALSGFPEGYRGGRRQAPEWLYPRWRDLRQYRARPGRAQAARQRSRTFP